MIMGTAAVGTDTLDDGPMFLQYYLWVFVV